MSVTRMDKRVLNWLSKHPSLIRYSFLSLSWLLLAHCFFILAATPFFYLGKVFAVNNDHVAISKAELVDESGIPSLYLLLSPRTHNKELWRFPNHTVLVSYSSPTLLHDVHSLLRHDAPCFFKSSDLKQCLGLNFKLIPTQHDYHTGAEPFISFKIATLTTSGLLVTVS